MTLTNRLSDATCAVDEAQKQIIRAIEDGVSNDQRKELIRVLTLLRSAQDKLDTVER